MEDLKAEIGPVLQDIRTRFSTEIEWKKDKLTRFLPNFISGMGNDTKMGYLASLTAAVSLQDGPMGRKVFARLERSAILALRFGLTEKTLAGQYHATLPFNVTLLMEEARSVLVENGFVLDQIYVDECENSLSSCSEQLTESVSRIWALSMIQSDRDLYLMNMGTLVSKFAGKVLGKRLLRNFEFHKYDNALAAAHLLEDREWCAPYESLTESEKQSKKPCGDNPALTFNKVELSSDELAIYELLKNITQDMFNGALAEIDASAYEIAQLLDLPHVVSHVQMPFQAPLIQEREGCSHVNYFNGPSCHNSSLEVQEKLKIAG